MTMWKRTPTSHILFFIVCSIFAAATSTFAAIGSPQTFTLDGQLTDPNTQAPLLDASAKIKVQILNPSKTCILYEEEQTIDTSQTNGHFTIQVGSNTGATKRKSNDAGNAMTVVFANSGTVPAVAAPSQTCAGNTYAPAAGDQRVIRLIVTPTAGVAETLSPDMPMDSVPQALVAQSVQGLEKSGILQVNPVSNLTQANLESLVAGSNYSNLSALIAGSSSKYVQMNSNGAALPVFASAPSSPSAGQMWFDSVRSV